MDDSGDTMGAAMSALEAIRDEMKRRRMKKPAMPAAQQLAADSDEEIIEAGEAARGWEDEKVAPVAVEVEIETAEAPPAPRRTVLDSFSPAPRSERGSVRGRLSDSMPGASAPPAYDSKNDATEIYNRLKGKARRGG